MRILEVTEADLIERGPHLDHHLMERLSQRGNEVIAIDYQIRWREHVDRPEDTLEQVLHLIESKSVEKNGLIAKKIVEIQDWGATTDQFEELRYKSCDCGKL